MSDTEIVCPAKKGYVALNMTNIYRAEERIQEIAFVTQHKAPELLAMFNMVFLELTRHITRVKYEKVEAEKAAERVRAVILLDKVPGILEAKGLTSARSPAGSEDLRNAILSVDPEYSAAVDKCDQVNAVLGLLEGKLKGIEWAYSSVKKILGENAYNHSNPTLKDSGSGGCFGNVDY